MSLLQQKIELCKPQLILTLGQEVAQVVHEKKSAPADDLLKDEIGHPEALNGYPTMHLPHPDACRRMEKWRVNLEKQIKTTQDYLVHGGD